MLALFIIGDTAARAQSAASDSGAPPAITSALSYTGEVVSDLAGGARHGTAYAGAAAAQFTLGLRRLAGWRGARVFVFLLDTHGNSPGDYAGDAQGVSNLQAPARLRLEEMWLQQNLLDNRLSVLAGLYDLNSEFYRLQSAALFVNSSFGMGPELAQSGVAGPSIFPNTAVGTRLDFKSSRNVVWRAAVLDGAPVSRAHGASRVFARGDGGLFVGEVALLERPDTIGMTHSPRFFAGRGSVHPYAGKIAVGAWYYTARFPDLSDTLASGAPVHHRGSGGAYIIGDRMMWSAGKGSARAVMAFVQLGLGDSRVNRIGSYAGGGLTLSAPIESRTQDQLGLAFAAARNGSHYDRARAASDLPAGSETALELTYLVHISDWLALQPDLQYVINPGNAPTARNALVPGLRVALSH